jgi:hypothetical protein
MQLRNNKKSFKGKSVHDRPLVYYKVLDKSWTSAIISFYGILFLKALYHGNKIMLLKVQYYNSLPDIVPEIKLLGIWFPRADYVCDMNYI